jgi:hypothetical protein
MKSITFTGKDKYDLDQKVGKWLSDNTAITVKKKHPIEILSLVMSKPHFGKIEAQDTVSIRIDYED